MNFLFPIDFINDFRATFKHRNQRIERGGALARDPPVRQRRKRTGCACILLFCACYSECAAYTPGAAVAKLAYAAGLKSAGDFPVVGSTPTSRTTLREMQKRASVEFPSDSILAGCPDACNRGWLPRRAFNGCRECFAVSWVIRNGICCQAVVYRCSRGAGSTC